MNRIHDDNDLTDVGKISGLLNTTSYYKELYFSRYDIYNMINHLDD